VVVVVVAAAAALRLRSAAVVHLLWARRPSRAGTSR